MGLIAMLSKKLIGGHYKFMTNNTKDVDTTNQKFQHMFSCKNFRENYNLLFTLRPSLLNINWFVLNYIFW